MAIELTQIHNVVRTYQWAIHLPPSAQQDIEQAAQVGEDQTSISADFRKQNGIHLQSEVLGVTD